MSEIKITINGKECYGNEGDTILKIAENNGIDIPTLCHNENVKHYGACGICVVEDVNSPKLLRACSTVARDNQVILTESEKVIKTRKIALELLISDHDGDCRGPCVIECPALTDCQGYIKHIANGEFKKAVELTKETNPLPASIGRVCPHPCEKACRRQLVEDPISIAYLKYFAADADLEEDTYIPQCKENTNKKVSVIGGGPAGLTVSYYLRLLGHNVVIYDMMDKMGGMLRYGIPEYRLPKKVLDKEIKLIENLGVEMKNNIKIDNNSFAEIKNESDAVVLAVGAWKSSSIRCKGEDTQNVYGGIDFLRDIALGNPPYIGQRTVIVGGGNTAMDCARSAVRLNAKEVYIVYRRTKDEMPAEEIEINEAEEEGVIYKFLRNPDEIISKDGKVEKVKLQVMQLGEADSSGRRKPVPVEGEFEYLEVDSVISAIGQKLDFSGFSNIELNERSNISVSENTFVTSDDKVFAIGDCTNRGASIAIEAIGEGNKAAKVIDRFLNGENIEYIRPYYSKREVSKEMYDDIIRENRVNMRHKSSLERRDNFDEYNYGFSKEEAIKEAKRCLECGCNDYYDCTLIKHANRYEIDSEKFCGEKRLYDVNEELVSIERNNGKCILCGLCVRTCDEIVKKGILDLYGRGFKTAVKPEFQNSDVINYCITCKKCAEVCPTGALMIKSK